MADLGGRGESGRPAAPPLGNIGGDSGIPDPSRGSRGIGDPRGRSIGRGLRGKPGLIGGATIVRSTIGAALIDCGERTAAMELGGDGPSGAASYGGGTATCRGLVGSIAGTIFIVGSAFISSFGFFFPDLLDLLERLRAASSCAASSRSRSSSSLVFRRPLFVTTISGICCDDSCSEPD